MAKAGVNVTYRHGKHNVMIKLLLYIWQKDNIFFVYSPSLDLTGYGKTEEEAKQSFEITLSEFLKYTHNKNTIYDELEHLGWTTNRKKKRINAPSIKELLSDNNELKELIEGKNYRTEERNVELALA